MNRQPLIRRQPPGSTSPWDIMTRIRLFMWQVMWACTCAWTPKPANRWRVFVLRRFGARIYGRPFVHQRARIAMPWNVTLHDASCVGDRANLYSQDSITLHAGALVAQEAYLCCGTHDLRDPDWPLMTAAIVVGDRAFVGARAFVMPGVTIGAGAVIGAGSVVTADVAPGSRVAGNPARPLPKHSAERG
jgi:putative colanic acid biosynthesis acetyltransferase WcaF